MSVKFLAIGDLHIRHENFTDIDILVSKVSSIIQNANPSFDFVVLLGDVLDKFINIKSTEQNKAYEVVDKLSKLCKTFVLVGNHDMINNQQFLTTNHSLYGLRYIQNVCLIEKVVVEKIKDKIFTFIPYVYPSRFVEALNTDETQTWSQSTVIFAHQEFKGAVYDSNTASTKGDEWPEEYPLVISGHIHGWSQLQENIIYVGSPMQHKVDELSEKFIWEFMFIDDEYTFNQIDLDLSEKRVIRLTVDEALNIDPKIDERFQKFNTKIKIVVTGETDEITALRKSKKFKILEKSCSGISTHTNDNKTYIQSQSFVKHEKKGFTDYLRDVIKNDSQDVKDTLEIVVRQLMEIDDE